MKKILSVIASIALFVSSANFTTIIAKGAEYQADYAQSEAVAFDIGTESEENNKLFSDYVNHVFYDGINTAPLTSSDSFSMQPSMGQIAHDIYLNAYEKAVYLQLIPQIEEIASGIRKNTEISGSIDFPGAVAVMNEDDGTMPAITNLIYYHFGSNKIIASLIADCPYLLYWHDKTEGVDCVLGGHQDGDAVILTYEFNFAVCADYSAGEYTTKGGLSIVQTAYNNAHEIVEMHKDESDYQKLLSYKEYITENVEYNTDDLSDRPYGNPWQLIWVFDGNPDTKVVCEGYAKAFQYLCDISAFKSSYVRCCSVDGIAGGPHMWNIVTMDDNKNYLVDITNSDTGAIGQNGGLFLSGTSQGNTDTGYTFEINAYNSVTYTYYTVINSISRIFQGNDILNLSSTDYVPDVVLSGANLSLSGNIGLNFYLSLSDEILSDPTAYMEMTFPGNKTARILLSSVKNKTYDVFGKTCYRFTAEVAAKEMTDEILTTFSSDKGTYNLSFNDGATGHVPSVKYYANEILSDSKYASAQPLVKAMLNYGSKAQTFFNYRADEAEYLADYNVITNIPSTAPDLSLHARSISGTIPEGLVYEGTSLLLKSNTIIRHYFSVENGHSIGEYNFSTDEQPVRKGSHYYVDIKDISAGSLNTSYNVTINNAYTISCSAMSYADRILTLHNNQPLEALVIALYYYNLNACEYAA